MRRIGRAGVCAVGLAALVATAGCGSDGGDSKPQARPPKPNYVHGFAYLQGPVSGATVSVYAKDGKLLARHAGETEKRGTFFMRVPKLPADYRVVAQGGRHLGKPFRGELRAEVRGDSGDVIHLNPVSTVVSHRVEQRPDVKLDKVENQVKDHLAIPAELDVKDLRVNRRYFNGRAFLRRAKPRGGVKAFSRKLASDVGSGADPHAFLGAASTRAPGGKASTRAPTGAGKASTRAPAVVGDPASDLLDSLVKNAGAKVGGNAAGWILAKLSAGGILPPSELDKINAQLIAINQQLAEIKVALGEISQDLKQQGYNQIVDTLPLAKIDHVQGELAWLIAHPTSADRNTVINTLVGTATTTGYIESNLQDAPELFGRAFTGGFDGTKLVAAYGQVALKKSPNVPFFTPADSGKIFSAYDYYDLYLLQGLDAVVEWMHAKGETDRPKDLVGDVVDKRKTVYAPTLPTRLPADGVVDTRSRLLWQNQTFVGLTFKQAVDSLNDLRSGGGDFQLPEPGQFQDLIKDRGGASPCDYLRPRGFDKALMGSQTCIQRDPPAIAWGAGKEGCQQPAPRFPAVVKTLDVATGDITCTRIDARGAGLFARAVSQDRFW